MRTGLWRSCLWELRGIRGGWYEMANKISNELEKGKSIIERIFDCPGCVCAHGFRTAGWPEPPGLSDEDKKIFTNKWTWNGSMDKPTLSPSLNVLNKIGVNEKNEPIYETICHSIIQEGKIQFLGDCKHELKGQTVELPDFEW